MKELFKDILNVGKQLIEYYTSRTCYEVTVIEKHLKTKIVEVKTISNFHNLIEKGVCAYAVDLLLKECKIVNAIYLDEDYIASPVAEDIEISMGNKVNLLVAAAIFLIYKNVPIVLDIEFNRYSSPIKYTVSYNSKNESIIKTFVGKLEYNIKYKNFLKNQIITPDGSFVKVDNYEFDDLVLPDEVLNELKLNIFSLFENVDLYKKNNLPIRRGLLLAGSPGTGKTLTLKIVSKLLKTTTIWVTASSVYNARDIKLIFEMARSLKPSVILFEDIDLYCKDREIGSDCNPILGEFLNQLDGLEENDGVVTLATTNYPEQIEKALKDRHNRFDTTITFELPDQLCRQKLLTKYCKDIVTQNVYIEKIAAITDGYSGAQLKELIVCSQFIAIEKKSLNAANKIILMTEHIKEAMKKVPKVKSCVLGFNVDQPIEDDEGR